MGKVSGDPRTYLLAAVELAERVMERPQDKDTALKLAIKVAALAEAFEQGAFKRVRRK